MSGHHATLLRGTVEAFLPFYDVYITDWVDARQMPLAAGGFDLDDYIDYLIAICESSAATNAACRCIRSASASRPFRCLRRSPLMEAADSPACAGVDDPDGRPDRYAAQPDQSQPAGAGARQRLVRDNCISTVPFGYHGAGREVYPGFLQLAGFMAMNIDRHVNAHIEICSAISSKATAIRPKSIATSTMNIFRSWISPPNSICRPSIPSSCRHALPKGEMMHRGAKVDPAAIRRVALMTVEGENDDISGAGQTLAAHDLCCNLPAHMQADYLQEKVGHYGVFNGSRFRNQIVPRILDFHAMGRPRGSRPLWSIASDRGRRRRGRAKLRR